MGNQQLARALTPKETAALGVEYKQLVVKVETQCAEQVAFLADQIAKDKNITVTEMVHLGAVLSGGGFKVALFRITSANALQSPQVQVTYDIHDDLDAYLRRPESLLPKRLVGFLEGGIDITDKVKDTAEDPHPLLGKTKIR